MVKWTKEQEEAIYTDGSDVLVAAAAGSGKTAVLVERIIQKLVNKEKPIDIDSLLVVTFTNAAAQEMRNRVGEALEKALALDPTSVHLKKQLALLQRASISTLHSFCLDIVKRYAYLLDIDPGFRIADDLEADLMQQEVLDELFEEWYGKEGTAQECFFAVVDRFSSDRSDVDVENLILSLYTFAIQNPWPEEWLDEICTVYEVPDYWQEEDFGWLTSLKEEMSNQFLAIEHDIKQALKIANESDGPYQYIDQLEADEKMVREAFELLCSWDKLQVFMTSSKFVRLSTKRAECNEDKKEKVKTIRNHYKDRWGALKKNYFTRDLAHHINDMRELAPIVKQLTELVKEFKHRFTELKQEKAVVDFSDLEHYCLQLLLDESSYPNQLIPSKIASSLKKQFTEVLVDEYQDTNLVQETILKLVSDQEGPGNMFMVGDVKQSIYRFRHAEPTLFIEKYKRFADAQNYGKRIDLARNFRSREHVLTGANYLFRQIIDEKLGEINYDKNAELIYGNKMYDELPSQQPNPELLIIDREDANDQKQQAEADENYLDLEKAQLEARAYAEKIKSWIGKTEKAQPLQVVDKETNKMRDVQYRDIVILLRSMTWAPIIVEELKKQGIPIYAELSTGYFEAIEVKIMISFLKAIDNPRQDIPLVAVLRSPIVGLNEEELAKIRLFDKKNTFYDALRKFERNETDETANKVSHFLKSLQRYRLLSRQGALSELIWHIYRETGYYDFVGGMPGGRQRQANLRALYDRSRGYEATSFRGLFRFLRFIERMEERGDDLGAARALSEQEDVVRIMTIHKSKGLEFPIVIVGAMDKQFNLQDLRERYLLHKDLGFACHYIDPVKRIAYPTLYLQAVKNEKLKEQLAEELRVLYVAITRAKEKLVMVGNVASFEKKQDKWQQMIDYNNWVFPAHFRMEMKSYLDWVGPALIRHNETEQLRNEQVGDSVLHEIKSDPSHWDITVIHGSELTNLSKPVTENDKKLMKKINDWRPLPIDQQDLVNFVENRLAYQYPYIKAATSRAKQTVTEIKRQRERIDEYSSDQMIKPFKTPIIKRPAFMQKEKTISAAEKGTTMHTVMQHLPMKRPMNDTEIREFIERLVEKEILRRELAEEINTTLIERFFHTSIAKTMMEAPVLYRELPFSLTIPASDVYPEWENGSNEKVLIQGVLDCVIPTEDGLIILDYKTDAITGEVNEQKKDMLIQRYKVQLNMYRYALETIWKRPVKGTYLYFFAKELLIKVP